MEVMDHDNTEDSFIQHQYVDYMLALHGFTVMSIIISMILILLLSGCQVLYFGCFWLFVWLVLFILFIASSSLRSFYPGNWIMALIINTSGGCVVGVLFVTSNEDGPILWTGAYAFAAYAFMVGNGTYVPCQMKPYIYLFIMFGVLIFGSVLTILLVYFLAHHFFLKVLIYLLVILWVFPFCVFQSQELHGYRSHGTPYDDLALGITFLVTDFLIIFTGFFWSITLEVQLKDYDIKF